MHSGLVDAVIIATPHYAHTTIGIEALKAGLHVMVEKPISVHKADAEKLLAAHTDKKQVFGAMLNQRFNPYFLAIKRLIDNGELGEIRRTNWIITDWFRPEIYYASGGWRGTWKGEGGGVLVNQCPHNIDLFQWMCGMPSSVRANCSFGRFHDIEVEDAVTAYFEYPNGATGVFITTTGEAPGTNRLEIAGDRGKIVAENDKITFTRNEIPSNQYSVETENAFGMPDKWVCEIPVPAGGNQHVEIMNNFIGAILDGTPLIGAASDGINSVELANSMLLSTWTNKTIELPMDSKAFERRLKKAIKESTIGEKVVRKAKVDITKSWA